MPILVQIEIQYIWQKT